MKSKLLTYQDLVAIARTHLEMVDNIRRFCIENNLQYTSVIAIKNGSKPYPYTKLISKLLSIFGYKVEKEILFKIFKIKTAPIR